jgi:hypothetical protein
VNKRFFLVLLLVAACSREQKAPSSPVTETHAPPPAPAPVMKPVVGSTPSNCAGDGSYKQAVDCFRIASGFHFTFNDGSGELKRPTQGMEHAELTVTKGADRGHWVADSTPRGVAWTRDGKAANDVPPPLARLYQRVTLFPDPQKREGSAQRVGDHFEFTDANSGDRYVVKVSPADGSIVEVTVNDLVMTFKR